MDFKRLFRRLFKLDRLLEFEYEIGDKVWDDLTHQQARIIGRTYHEGRRGSDDNENNIGSVGYWLDNDYLGGGRHPWEIVKA